MTTRTCTEKAIYSSLGGDPDLSELVALYVTEMPDRIATMASAFKEGDDQTLLCSAHQLKGAAAGYGFDALSPLAAAVEDAVRDGEPQMKIDTLLNELLSACGRIRAGQPS